VSALRRGRSPYNQDGDLGIVIYPADADPSMLSPVLAGTRIMPPFRFEAGHLSRLRRRPFAPPGGATCGSPGSSMIDEEMGDAGEADHGCPIN
jgi:hypothetical protein